MVKKFAFLAIFIFPKVSHDFGQKFEISFEFAFLLKD